MLKIKQNETTLLEFVLTDSSGVIIDLTGATFTYTIKETIDSSGYLYQHVDSDILNPTLGIVNVEITNAETALFPLGDYLSEVKLQNVDSQIFYSDIAKVRVIDVLTD